MIFLIVYFRIRHALRSGGSTHPFLSKIKIPPYRWYFHFGGSGWIRTTSVVRQQIYSLPRLSNSGARPELIVSFAARHISVVRAAGIEPAFQAWKACILAFELCSQRIHKPYDYILFFPKRKYLFGNYILNRPILIRIRLILLPFILQCAKKKGITYEKQEF